MDQGLTLDFDVLVDFNLGLDYDVICVSLIILILRLGGCLGRRSRGRGSKDWCGRYLLLFLFLSETFESLVDHLFRESLLAKKDALLEVGDLLHILAT